MSDKGILEKVIELRRLRNELAERIRLEIETFEKENLIEVSNIEFKAIWGPYPTDTKYYENYTVYTHQRKLEILISLNI